MKYCIVLVCVCMCVTHSPVAGTHTVVGVQEVQTGAAVSAGIAVARLPLNDLG